MSAVPRPAPPLPRRVLDALLAFVNPVRVLEVTAGPSAARTACERAGVAHASVAELRRRVGEAPLPGDGEPDLVLLTAVPPPPESWCPLSHVEDPVSSAWLALPPDGVVAIWVPPGAKRWMLGAVIGALPRWRLHAVWAIADPGPAHVDEGSLRRAACGHLVLFRAPPEPGAEQAA